MFENIKSKIGLPDKSLFAGGGILAGIAALFSASCCVLPLVLINIGVSTSFVANLAPFGRYRAELIGLTIAFLLISLSIAFFRGQRFTPRFWTASGVALLLSAAAYYLPFYEGEIQRWMGLS